MRRILAVILALTAATGAVAQTPPPQAAPPAAIDPPYHARMERLAETLGALHHLRGLCVPAEADVWRREMAALIEVEQPGPDRRDRLVGAFNRGLSAFRETYRTCTPAAQLAAERYRTEAAAIAQDLASRFAD